MIEIIGAAFAGSVLTSSVLWASGRIRSRHEMNVAKAVEMEQAARASQPREMILPPPVEPKR